MKINLLKYNLHWEKNFFYPYTKKRQIFRELFNHLKQRQVIEIVGLRRVGKSVLIYQLINDLKNQKTAPDRIIYFTYDEEQPKIDELLEEYHLQTGVDYRKEKIYVFLDEIQKLSNFQNQIKVLYDLYPNVKFIISGSTSLFIKKKTQESLAGRIISYFINPLSFPEYLFFKDRGYLKKPLLYQKELKKEFDIFLTSQTIESIDFKKPQDRKEYFLSIIKKIVFEDMPTFFRVANPQILYRIVQFIGQKPGCLINNIHLGEELGISNKTVALYLSYLEDSYLIKKHYNFSSNLISSEKKLKKYYLASPSYSWSLVDFVNDGALMENYFSSQIRPSYFSRDPYKNEVDFVVLGKNNEIMPYEIKYMEKIGYKEIKNLLLFMEKYSLTKGFLFCLETEKRIIDDQGRKIYLLPFFTDIKK